MKNQVYNKKMPMKKANNVVDKKSEKRNQIYAYILCGLFVFWTIASVLGIVSFVRTNEKSAGVEMVTASAETLEQIETFPQYYAKIPAGSVWTVGNGNAQSYYMSGRLNFEVDSNTFLMVNIGVSYGSKNPLFSDSLLFKSIYDLTVVDDFYFAVNSAELSFTKVKLYLNSSVTYLTCSLTEFEVVSINGGGGFSQEELDEAYNNGYTAGVTAGKEAGYQEGYTNASNLFKSGIFANASYKIDLTDWVMADGEKFGDVIGVYENIPSNALTLGGLNVSVLFDTYIAGGGTFSGWSLTFKFAEPVPVSVFSVGAVGGASVNIPSISIQATAVDSTVVLDPHWVEDENGTTIISFMGAVDTSISSITFSLSRREDSVAFTLYDLNYRNSALIQDSFNKGYSAGNAEGLRNGRELGYADGKAVGYKEGVAAANDYTFEGLLTAVIDVPVQTFMSLFNFEILGVNLSNFFLALLSICIVLAVVKLLI